MGLIEILHQNNWNIRPAVESGQRPDIIIISPHESTIVYHLYHLFADKIKYVNAIQCTLHVAMQQHEQMPRKKLTSEKR